MKSKELKLIVESAMDTKIITEGFDGKSPKTIKMQGVYIQADVRNGNNRVYDYEILKPQVDKFIEEKIKTNTALEELEHPDSPTINPERVCARTISLVEEDKQWVGTSVVLASDPKFGIKGTPQGDIVASLLTFDCALGHSSRSLGNVDPDGRVSDLQLLFIDTVTCPSIGIFNDSNANRMMKGVLESKKIGGFVNGILESKSFIVNTHGEILEEKFNSFENMISKMPKTNIGSVKAEFLGNAVSEFLKSFSM